MLCFVPVLRGCVWYVCCYVTKKSSSPSVFAITVRRDTGLYEVPLSMSLLSFGMRTMLADFHMCGIMLVIRAVFNMLERNASPRGPMCFRCLMFSLSGLVSFYFYLVLLPIGLSCGECDVIFLYVVCCSVMCLFVLCVACLTVFVNYLVNKFAICLGVVVYFVVECYGSVFVWVEVLCWIDRVWSSKECTGCACDPSVHLNVPSQVLFMFFACGK